MYMYSYVLYYNIEKFSFNAVSASLVKVMYYHRLNLCTSAVSEMITPTQSRNIPNVLHKYSYQYNIKTISIFSWLVLVIWRENNIMYIIICVCVFFYRSIVHSVISHWSYTVGGFREGMRGLETPISFEKYWLNMFASTFNWDALVWCLWELCSTVWSWVIFFFYSSSHVLNHRPQFKTHICYSDLSPIRCKTELNF